MELCARTVVEVRVARSPEDVAAHHAVREAVFVAEQGIFDGHDRDAWDEGAIKVVASIAGRVVGAVRLYPLDEAGLWKGDRLAVLPDARTVGVGAPLVRFAVEEGPLAGVRKWMLHTRDMHPLYRKLGFAEPDDRYLERWVV